jgi:glucose-1-phosphate cytidylyltransferase
VRVATVSAVQPPGRFGALTIEGDRVRRFSEKEAGAGAWINGGFFVLSPRVGKYLGGDDCILEREPLERLAAEGELHAYRHAGFWHPMDTLRDKRYLEELWDQGAAPWRV